MRNVVVLDNQPPEVGAMLQAMYSRSPRSVEYHLTKIKEGGAARFMAQHYVGYGHRSIGDCATTTVFAENVSILVAKAIQDHTLYNGQEASTRYLDMSKQQLVDPCNSSEGRDIQKRLMEMYERVVERLKRDIAAKNPREVGEKEAEWEKAVKAAAFDVARALLPAGITTYVAWHTNLRQAKDRLMWLGQHPLSEVRSVAMEIGDKLKSAYPSSFDFSETAEERMYRIESMLDHAYTNLPMNHGGKDWVSNECWGLERATIKDKFLLESRPRKCELHPSFRDGGYVHFRFSLDYGSFRDIQRHRSALIRMPLLTTDIGIHGYYLNALTQGEVDELRNILRDLDSLNLPPLLKQYYIPMGCEVMVDMRCDLPSAVYIAELRSKMSVHPTLREKAQWIGKVIAERAKRVGIDIRLYVDTRQQVWSVIRGKQDIVELPDPPVGLQGPKGV